jgi:hypothetical protein
LTRQPRGQYAWDVDGRKPISEDEIPRETERLALGVAIVGTAFFSELGSGTSPASFGDAFSVSLAIQAAFALTASALVSRARQSTRERAPGALPAGEGA